MADNEPMRTPEAAAYLGVSPSTMRNWRRRGGGPKWGGIPGHGGCVTYALADLETYKEKSNG